MITKESDYMKKARSDPVHAVLYLLYGKNFDVSKEKERVKFKGTLNVVLRRCTLFQLFEQLGYTLAHFFS